MRGSILVTFDELINNRGIDNFLVFVNGVLRDRHFTDTNNLYSTYVNVGDVVSFHVQYFNVVPIVSIIRKDYTTDDEDGDRGIKEVLITPTIIQGTNATIFQFTVSTVISAYDYKYLIDASTLVPTPTPTPTFTPTPTPTITPTPTPTPTDGCIYPQGSMNFTYEYNWFVNPLAEAPDFYVQEFGAYYHMVSGGCTNFSTLGSNPITTEYTTYSGQTVWNTSKSTTPGIGGLRDISAEMLSSYNTGTTTNMYRTSASYGELFVNGVSQGTTTWVEWNDTQSFPDAFYPYSVPQINQFYRRRYLQFGNHELANSGDTVTIKMYDYLEPRYNDFTLEYNWNNSNETNGFNIVGSSSYNFGIPLIPEFTVQNLSGTTGTYLTPSYKGVWNPSSPVFYAYLQRCNNTIAEKLLTRIYKLFVNSVEVTGETTTISGVTTNFVEVCPALLGGGNYENQYDRGSINNLDDLKIQVNDTFIIVPTPTPTPTVTPPTPTPTPTVTPPTPVTWRFRYIAGGGTNPPLKTASNLNFVFNGITYSRSNVTYGISANSLSTITTDTNIATDQFFINRDLCKSTATINRLDLYNVQVIVNSVQVYNQTTNLANPNIPTCSAQDSRTETTGGITISAGDIVEVIWTDTLTV
jgi:hypothetical protein